MEKIILTKRQARGLEKALKRFEDKSKLFNNHVEIINGISGKWSGDNFQYLNELSVEQMAIALYVGYEVEETKEEKILKHYNELIKAEKWANGNIFEERKKGIEDTLYILGVEIEGINK